MKDSQGAHIVNPETTKIIRNLRGKAIHEGKNRDFYLNSFLADYALTTHDQGLSSMAAFELYGQKWCLDNGIIGYEYITNVSFANVRKEE